VDSIEIVGGKPLRGTISVSGAKNAALPLFFSTLLANGRSTLANVPALRDIRTAAKLLRSLGATVDLNPPHVSIDVPELDRLEAPYEVVKEMRASILVLGPLVARYGRGRVSLPGGCAIGARPIDQHLKGLQAMGAQVDLEQGNVHVHAPRGRLQGADFTFDMVTVTGTENLLCAATLASGTTVLRNAACEPEVTDLARALQAMGAAIDGIGTQTLTIEGREALKPLNYTIMPDRIEAGTYMVAAAATGGDVFVQGAQYESVRALAKKMREAGVFVEGSPDGVHVRGEPPYVATHVCTAPYPLFPTDMQAQFMALMCLAQGQSSIEETVFENRFMHVAELLRMGAKIRIRGHLALVDGPVALQGATVMATDLRASASLVIAALAAKGTTQILRVYHLDRGYEHLERKLAHVGADIRRVPGHA
jgi:UDP-N-acetylglucosamine 1-carboxyvinyltransferase